MDVKDYEKYAKARNQARWECRKAKKIFERTLAKGAKRNPKAIFSYVNSKLKTKAGIADVDIETGKATTDSEKAEALNEFFSDTFTNEDTSNIPSFHTEDIRKLLEELKITEEKVKERLESLKRHKSPGPDGLDPRVLKELSNEISKPLAIIMQKSLDEHTLPQNWKDAHVSPIYTTKIDGVVCPPNISETVADRTVKLAHRPRIASTTIKFISKPFLLSIL